MIAQGMRRHNRRRASLAGRTRSSNGIARYDHAMSSGTWDSSITESTPLVAELRERIRRDGPITFRDFMDAALYDPRWGYYPNHPDAISRQGDYVTSPEVHPVFGGLVARQLGELWEAAGRPDHWTIVEQGVGRGILARDVL